MQFQYCATLAIPVGFGTGPAGLRAGRAGLHGEKLVAPTGGPKSSKLVKNVDTYYVFRSFRGSQMNYILSMLE